MAIRIVGISDTHGSHECVAPINGDILVVAGDFCGMGGWQDIVNFNTWLGTLPHRYKIVVPGNHDLVCQNNNGLMKTAFTNAIYLDMEAAEVMGVKFFGVPWTPEFYNWAYMYPRDSEKAERIWAAVPEDTNILISHGTPYGAEYIGCVKDSFGRPGEDVGCKVLRKRMIELPMLQASFHGHIHSGSGVGMVGSIRCMNVSVLNELYDVVKGKAGGLAIWYNNDSDAWRKVYD